MTRGLVLAVLCASGVAAAQPISDREILGPRRGTELESFRVRFTHFDQEGRGYQSQADRPGPFSPGSEQATIEQPQAELIVRQGERVMHRLWVPVDVVSAASPDALDAISTASRHNEAGSFDLATTYQMDRRTDVTVRAAFHIEEPLRSWLLGVAGRRAFADDNTIISASLNQSLDWFDRFNLRGSRLGRAYRSSTNANLALTQLLSPTTVGHLNYGATVQLGELSNTWNAVPLRSGELGVEKMPALRHRHALVARIVQALPWRGALKGYYRFYADNWGIVAHTLETQLYQRVGRYGWLRGSYRVHVQSGAAFFTIAGDEGDGVLRTADSDLATFIAQSAGILAALDLRVRNRHVNGLHIDFGYEHYFRSNGLRANIYTCALGFRF